MMIFREDTPSSQLVEKVLVCPKFRDQFIKQTVQHVIQPLATGILRALLITVYIYYIQHSCPRPR